MEATASSISFTITKGDLFRLQLRALLRSRVIWGMYLVFLAVVVNGLLSAPSVKERSVAYQVFFACFGAALFTIPFCFLQLLVLANAVLGKKHQGLVGEHTLRLTPEGLEESTAFNTGVHKWAGIHRVDSTTRYLFIYINESMAHIVPKQAFSCVAEAELFEQQVRQLMLQSKSTSSSSR